MDRSHVVIAFLLGICVALGVALIVQTGEGLPRAYAQAAAGGDMFAVTGTGTTSQSRDILFIVDKQSARLMVFEYKDGRLELGAVRNMEYDLRFEEWSARGKVQKPTVKEQRAQTENTGKGKQK